LNQLIIRIVHQVIVPTAFAIIYINMQKKEGPLNPPPSWIINKASVPGFDVFSFCLSNPSITTSLKHYLLN
jgi:hypothetical protein